MSEISYKKPVNPKWKDLSGQKFGKLTVESFSHIVRSGNQNRSYWNCTCECGNEVSVCSSSLASGNVSSCGCYQRERTSKTNTKHGLSQHPLYDRCEKILNRCYNQNNKAFHNYGGREQSDPIFVQESWRNDIGLMIREIEAEIGLPPFKGANIDRKENHLGYKTGNLRWVTPEENQRNKRDTHNHAVDPITRKQTPTYNIWTGMIRDYYSEVCTEWKDDGNCETSNGFKNFFNDMGEKPNLGYRKHSPLKRYDETKPWCRENCYWKIT